MNLFDSQHENFYNDRGELEGIGADSTPGAPVKAAPTADYGRDAAGNLVSDGRSGPFSGQPQFLEHPKLGRTC